MSKYTLADAEERNAKNPRTFWIPSQADRIALKVGDNAKLVFEQDGDAGERMWVKVTEVVKPGEYKGKINNDPVVIIAKYGDRVKFKAKHIIDIL